MNNKPIQEFFEAMYHDKYSFDDFMGCDLSKEYTPLLLKSRTKDRLVYKTTKKLKTFHSFLNLFIFEYLDINPRVVFSYRKGFNALDAISKHSLSNFFFQTDIADFFPNLSTSIVRKTIEKSIASSPAIDAPAYIDRILDLVIIDDCLPQGFSTSPILSNACLFEFDDRLEEYCIKNGLIYTRYSDDIIISSQKEESLAPISLVISSILESTFHNKLQLNPLKSKYTRKGNKVKLLGLVITPTGKVTIDKKVKNQIETGLYRYKNDRSKFLELDWVENDIATGTDVMFGLLNYISTIDKEYLDKLRKKFGVTTVDMFLRRPAK